MPWRNVPSEQRVQNLDSLPRLGVVAGRRSLPERLPQERIAFDRPAQAIFVRRDAELVISDKVLFDGGAILQIVIWRVPGQVEASAHDLKYRLFYGYPGNPLIGYDNERVR